MKTTQLTLPNNAPLIVIALLLVDSLHFVFARLLLPHLPPAVSVVYVLGAGTAEVVIFSLIWGQIDFGVFRRHVWFFLTIGFLIAASTILSYSSVAFIDPGTASLLAQTSVLFGIMFGLVWLRERLTGLDLAGIVVALAGVFIISFQPGDYLRFGSLVVLISAFLYALHAAVVKRYGASLGLAEFFLFRLLSTTAFLLLFVLGQGTLRWPGLQAWLLILLAGTVDVVLSRVLYYLALRRLQLSFHSLVLTVSPVVTILWSLALFGLWPAPRELIGGLGVLAGVLLVTAGRSGLVRVKRLPAAVDSDTRG